jgi:acetoacetyl-CoA reductase
MDSTTSKRTALVTGGMGGLGTAICQHLARAGVRVVTTYSDHNSLHERWLQDQRANGMEFSAYNLDVTDFSACQVVVDRIRLEVGPIDILINNAGITRDTTARKMTLDDWASVLHTNLDSVFNMTRQVIEDMSSRNWGRIVNISSVNGQKGSFGQTNYCAAKAGMHGYTKALALELARKGVTVNTVSPGYLRTSMVTRVPADVLANKILPEIPVGRLGEPDEVAALITFLVSDQAAFITGANLAINGGQHMY